MRFLDLEERMEDDVVQRWRGFSSSEKDEIPNAKWGKYLYVENQKRTKEGRWRVSLSCWEQIRHSK